MTISAYLPVNADFAADPESGSNVPLVLTGWGNTTSPGSWQQLTTDFGNGHAPGGLLAYITAGLITIGRAIHPAAGTLLGIGAQYAGCGALISHATAAAPSSTTTHS